MSVKTLVTVVKFIALAGVVMLVCGTTADGFPLIYSVPPIHAVADALWHLFQFGMEHPLVPTILGIGGMLVCVYKA